MGACYNMAGQYYKAIEMFDKGIALSPNDGFPYYNKGVSYFYLKQYTNAKINMEKAVELDPGNEIYTRELQRFLAAGFI